MSLTREGNVLFSDWPEIQRLHEEQNFKQGTQYEAPRPGPHIAVALVAEDQQGVIRQAVVVERVAEMALYGMDPKATAFSQRDITGLAFILRSQGFRWLHTLVPAPPVPVHSETAPASGVRRSRRRNCYLHDSGVAMIRKGTL